MPLAPFSRIFALIDHELSAGAEMEGDLRLAAVMIRLNAHRLPPWDVSGIVDSGGWRPLERFERLNEARTYAQERFGGALTEWQPTRPTIGSHLGRLLGNDDWRLPSGHSHRDLRGATLSWTRFVPPTPGHEHEHCVFCWAKFMDLEDPEMKILRAGFVTENEEWVCEQCYHDLKEVLRLRTELP
jgi:hypothetical protein